MNLEPSLETPEVQALLLALVGWRDDDALDRAALERATSAYRQDDALYLYGTFRQGGLAGLIGLETASAPELTLRHLVVHPVHRGAGVGRGLIEAVWGVWQPYRLVAETDKSAVGFYRRCGFSVRSLGETYPGTERFSCVLEREGL